MISRRIREERAGGRCECLGECGAAHHLEPDGDGTRCSRREGQTIPGNLNRWPVVLTTAHLDHDPGNVDEENLRALCQRCHLRYDRHLHAERRASGADSRRGQARLFDGEPPWPSST